MKRGQNIICGKGVRIKRSHNVTLMIAITGLKEVLKCGDHSYKLAAYDKKYLHRE